MIYDFGQIRYIIVDGSGDNGTGIFQDDDGNFYLGLFQDEPHGIGYRQNSKEFHELDMRVVFKFKPNTVKSVEALINYLNDLRDEMLGNKND